MRTEITRIKNTGWGTCHFLLHVSGDLCQGQKTSSLVETSPVEIARMSSVGKGQMSAVETGQMSAAEAGQMSAVESRQMSAIEKAGNCRVFC